MALGVHIGVSVHKAKKAKIQRIEEWTVHNICELRIKSIHAFKKGRDIRVSLLLPNGKFVRLCKLECGRQNFFHNHVKPASDALEKNDSTMIDFGNIAVNISRVAEQQRLGRKKHRSGGGRYGVFPDCCLDRKQGLNGQFALRFQTCMELGVLIKNLQ